MDGWRSQGIKDGLLQVMPKMTETFDAMLKRQDQLFFDHNERLSIAHISESNIKILEQNNETLERNYKAQVEAAKRLAPKVKTYENREQQLEAQAEEWKKKYYTTHSHTST